MYNKVIEICVNIYVVIFSYTWKYEIFNQFFFLRSYLKFESYKKNKHTEQNNECI